MARVTGRARAMALRGRAGSEQGRVGSRREEQGSASLRREEQGRARSRASANSRREELWFDREVAVALLVL